MTKSRFLWGFVAVCMCLVAFAGFAKPAPVKWPVYKGSMLSYLRAHLPLPTTIYKYDADGKLVGVFSASRTLSGPANGQPAVKSTANDLVRIREKMRKFIVSGAAQQPDPDKLAGYAVSLKHFMQDQGYQLHELIDHQRTYTLILAETDMSKNTCPRYKKAHRADLDAVRRAIHEAPATQSYAVRQLVIGGMALKFQC